MSETCQVLVSINNSLSLIVDKTFVPKKLRCDNRSVETNSKTDKGNKLRHMTEVKEYYVKECVKRKLIEINWVPSKEQIADIFTKPLPYVQHKILTDKILNLIE